MNCIIIDDDKLSRRVIEEYINKTGNISLNGSFSAAVDAINYLKQHEVDLIFLDIEMPEMTGIDFLNTLKTTPQIIIISSKGKYAINAFEYDVIDYLLKPVSYARFYKAVDKAIGRNQRDGNLGSVGKDEIFIKKNSSLVRLKYNDILWIEALENYVIFNTFNDKYTIHYTMKAAEQKLPSNKFTRVHRSYIVNTNSIRQIEDNAIIIKTIDGNKSIPIGKSYRNRLMNDLNLIIK